MSKTEATLTCEEEEGGVFGTLAEVSRSACRSVEDALSTRFYSLSDVTS